MRRTGFLFDQIASFENLYKAFHKALKGSGRSESACQFCFNLEPELFNLQNELQAGTYRPFAYRYFTIYDPKERIISVAPFRDRVLHHAVVRILEPVFERSFIYDSYATRKEKGTHKAILRAKKFLKSNRFYLKIDISKYFFNIDHDILLEQVKRKIKDKHVISLIETIVWNSDWSQGIKTGKGLPIGNLTSQFFANVYLNSFDHFVKDHLGIKNYIRYMDDMVVFSNSKCDLHAILKKMVLYLQDNLRLELNPNATKLHAGIHGLPFLGFRIYPNLIRIKKENLKRIQQRMTRKKKDFLKGKIPYDRFVMSIRSMFDHIGVANSYCLRQSFIDFGADVH